MCLLHSHRSVSTLNTLKIDGDWVNLHFLLRIHRASELWSCVLAFPKMGWSLTALAKVTCTAHPISVLSLDHPGSKKKVMKVKFWIILLLEAIFPVSPYIFTEGSCHPDIPSVRIPVLSWMFGSDHKSDPSGSSEDGSSVSSLLY